MRARRFILSSAALFLLSWFISSGTSADTHQEARLLDTRFLLEERSMTAPVMTQEYAPRKRLKSPADAFEGTLQIESTTSGINVVHDEFGVTTSDSMAITTLPPFNFKFVGDGQRIVPLVRHPIANPHPYWEFILEAGMSWREAGDGAWSRAALPFALKETNQNCLHNGLMTFLYREDGAISKVVWQIGSETCPYLKIDLWGKSSAVFEPHSIEAHDEVLGAQLKLQANRIPVKPVENLLDDYPTLDSDVFVPPDHAQSTVSGLLFENTHYRSDCPTRYGPYPFCDDISLPSYSLAKSLFAGIWYLRMIRLWPEFSDARVAEWVPECRLPDRRWDDVTANHLVNMMTGNYDSAIHGTDEGAAKMQRFFMAETHTDKIAFSCSAWPRSSAPGSTGVYHTTDHYLLGTVMSAYFEAQRDGSSDIFRDGLHADILSSLELSPLMDWTQRTYDPVAQPFVAYGLVLQPDDVVRLSDFLNTDEDLQNLLPDDAYQRAFFQVTTDPGSWNQNPNQAYQFGFWGINAADWLNCEQAVWIPFMSGFGGQVVALFPNNSVYYHFSDANWHRFKAAAIESNKLKNYCGDSNS